MYKPEDYLDLTFEKFDAVVTGELTHQSLYCEGELVGIITEHFCRLGTESDFRRLLLYRDGLTFQDKIEIVRAMVPLFPDGSITLRLKAALRRVEDLKALRNAFAHGLDSSGAPNDDLCITVEIVSRSGTEKQITVRPEKHCQTMQEADQLVNELHKIRKELLATRVAAELIRATEADIVNSDSVGNAG